jgi:hypothetical protein
MFFNIALIEHTLNHYRIVIMQVVFMDDINREMVDYMERHGKTKAGEQNWLEFRFTQFDTGFSSLWLTASWIKSGLEIVKCGSSSPKGGEKKHEKKRRSAWGGALRKWNGNGSKVFFCTPS